MARVMSMVTLGDGSAVAGQHVVDRELVDGGRGDDREEGGYLVAAPAGQEMFDPGPDG